ncbi:MAG: glycerate kinase [Acidimicrobiales bacterium]
MASSTSDQGVGGHDPDRPAPAGRAVVAFDKFRGTATAAELVRAGVAAALDVGWRARGVPVADGGEGSLDAIGGANKRTEVADPLGRPVMAGWRLDGRRAFIEMAAASGLDLVADVGNDPVNASTRGTGQLITTAVELRARTITVFLGGSATTDGGWGALEAMPRRARMAEFELIVATDVTTRFLDAAEVFGPQKGASPAQVSLLRRRLERLAQVYADDYGVTVTERPGAGAAGGLAGGLLTVGGRIEPGFEVVADEAGLFDALEDADLVVTGEGRLDDQSFRGKVVGGVAALAADADLPVLAVVGSRAEEVTVPAGVRVISLADRFGIDEAFRRPVELVGQVVGDYLSDAGGRSG